MTPTPCSALRLTVPPAETHHNPYLTHENKPTVIAEHKAKAMSGDAMHARLESDMKAVEKRNFRKRQKVSSYHSLHLHALLVAAAAD